MALRVMDDLMAFERELNEPDNLSDIDVVDAPNDTESSPCIKSEPISPSPSVLRRSSVRPSFALSSRMTVELYKEMMDISTNANIEMIPDDEDEQAKFLRTTTSGCPSSPIRNVWREAGV